MTAIRTAETRTITITLALADTPDITTWQERSTVAPDSVEITYQWAPDSHRPSYFRIGFAGAKVHGLRRLKSGGVVQQEISVDYWPGSAASQPPEWLAELIAEHMPPEFTA